MLDKLETVWHATRHSVALILDRTAAVDPWWLAAGVALYFVSQTVRTRGWFHIIRAAYPDARALRARDVARAYLCGAGLNALVPARGGDLLKLAMVKRRAPGSRYSTLAATFVPETLFETAVGIALVVWALAMGFLPVPTSSGALPDVDVSLVVAHPFITTAALAAVATLVVWVARRLRRQLRQGMAILKTPRRFLTGVASWQALARLIRLGSFAAFMAAFGLPVTPATVVLVMAAQGAGRIIPLAPASAGLRLAMLSYGFVEVTHHVVDIAAITAFTFGTGALLAATGLVVSAAIAGAEFGTLHPRRLIVVARARAAEGLG
jgi:uncharacterized membrane protein YbhN (UPF0104 family)